MVPRRRWRLDCFRQQRARRKVNAAFAPHSFLLMVSEAEKAGERRRHKEQGAGFGPLFLQF